MFLNHARALVCLGAVVLGAGCTTSARTAGPPLLDARHPERQEGRRVRARGRAEIQDGKGGMDILRLDDGSHILVDGSWPPGVDETRVTVEGTVRILPPSPRGDVQGFYRPVRVVLLGDWKLLQN
jgi:hypothetical protein